MSEIIERINIISIAAIPGQDMNVSMGKLEEMSTYRSMDMVLSNMRPNIKADILNAIQSTTEVLNNSTNITTLNSPNMLRASFKNSFIPTLLKMEAKGINPIVAKKATLINTLDNMDFKIKHSDLLSSNLNAVVQANDMNTLNTEIKTLMNKLEIAHTNTFANNIANACAIASRNIGFEKVEIKLVQGNLEVIARNNLGQHLLTEVYVDPKTNQVNANTETIGMTDGSCTSKIKQFNEELKKMNIRIGNERSTFTKGVCQMSYSRIIDQQEKESRKHKEMDRVRKLNNNQQLKN